MWLQEAEEFFKGYLPYYVLIFLPIFILMSPVNPVAASHEFPVYRMQQFDLHGVPHGCRSAGVNLEARSLSSWSTPRHCVVTRLSDLTIDHFRNLRTKAGALIVMLPQELSQLPVEEKQNLLLLENAMLLQEINIPVYFAKHSEELDSIITELSQNIDSNDLSKSAAEAIMNSVAANGYQIVVGGSTPSVRNDVKVATLQGLLPGYSTEGKLPIIALVAHYDSFSVAPELAFGADSNASGVIILFELIRLFSGLYSDSRSHGKYNLLFILSGGGKINFQGTKKWLEDQLDSLDGSLIQEASYVMCLDTLAASDNLYMHVSKPPKEGSAASVYFKELKSASERLGYVSVEGVHKKINLADDLLAWEHERFSIRRLPAFTLSSLKSHRDSYRSSMTDVIENVDVERLMKQAKVIAEALASQIYNVSVVGNIFGNSLDVDRTFVEAWLEFLAKQPRSPQLLSTKDNWMVQFLKENFNKYLREVKVSYAVPDKRDPEFQFYEDTKSTMNVYSVKPAVFDLILTLAIIVYLTAVYLLIQYFPKLYTIACTLTKSKQS